MNKLIFALVAVIGCAALNMPVKEQIKTGASVACAVLQSAGCFDRIQDTLPGVGASTCSTLVGTILDLAFLSKRQRADTKVFGVDQSKINFDAINIEALQKNTGQTCADVERSLGIIK
jgi:hypothetical protein